MKNLFVSSATFFTVSWMSAFIAVHITTNLETWFTFFSIVTFIAGIAVLAVAVIDLLLA